MLSLRLQVLSPAYTGPARVHDGRHLRPHRPLAFKLAHRPGDKAPCSVRGLAQQATLGHADSSWSLAGCPVGWRPQGPETSRPPSPCRARLRLAWVVRPCHRMRPFGGGVSRGEHIVLPWPPALVPPQSRASYVQRQRARYSELGHSHPQAEAHGDPGCPRTQRAAESPRGHINAPRAGSRTGATQTASLSAAEGAAVTAAAPRGHGRGGLTAACPWLRKLPPHHAGPTWLRPLSATATVAPAAGAGGPGPPDSEQTSVFPRLEIWRRGSRCSFYKEG